MDRLLFLTVAIIFGMLIAIEYYQHSYIFVSVNTMEARLEREMQRITILSTSNKSSGRMGSPSDVMLNNVERKLMLLESQIHEFETMIEV